MPETVTQDEVVSNRQNNGAGATFARPVVEETVEVNTGVTKVTRSGVEEDSVGEGSRRGRVYKESTLKLLDKFEAEEKEQRAPSPHEEGDADETEEESAADEGDADPADEGDEEDAGGGDEEDEGEEESEEEAEGEEDGTQVAKQWQTTAETLEQRNREILAELDTARKTPTAQRSERETALLAAEASYIDEGSVPALRKFLGIIVGAAPDSKEVDAELTGVYADLTARELGVPLDSNQQALRDNARTRLLLARDKREKAESEKKPNPSNDAEVVQYEQAAKYVDNLLVTKGQSGTSIADEYPRLMALAENFDGYKPAEVIARAIRQEITVGTLDPKTDDVVMIRAVASKIEKHYEAVAKKIREIDQKMAAKKPDTTNTSVKSKIAIETSKEQRQSHGARTITNATASRAPAKPPKTTKQKAPIVEKTRKDFSSDAAWREHLLSVHFPS